MGNNTVIPHVHARGKGDRGHERRAMLHCPLVSMLLVCLAIRVIIKSPLSWIHHDWCHGGFLCRSPEDFNSLAFTLMCSVFLS